jgi:purine catabolism regulator
MLKGGELLLTTGMGIGRTDAERRRFIIELAERECAAVAIELGTSLRRVPPPLATEADRRELPLIAFHREVRFVDITEAVHREIVSRQLNMTVRGDALHNRYLRLLLDGARVPELLTAVADTISNPVVLERAGVGMLYHATFKARDAEVFAAWDRFTNGLAGAPDTAEYPIPAGSTEEWGRLVSLAIDSPLDEDDRVAIERAVGLIALTLLREHEDESIAMRERGNFLAGLLDGNVDEAEVRTRASEMGFGRDVSYMLPLVVARSSPAAMRATEEASWARAWRQVRRELSARRMGVIAGTREHERQLLMVVALGHPDARTETADVLTAIVHQKTKRYFGDGAVCICVGPTGPSWSAVGVGLQAAIDALSIGDRAQDGLWYDAARPDLDRVLFALRGQSELRQFAEARLGPLIRSGRTSRLLPTLAAYCEHAGRKTETARALQIKRQTLYTRLDRIQELLEVDLRDGETLLALHLALRVMRYVDT